LPGKNKKKRKLSSPSQLEAKIKRLEESIKNLGLGTKNYKEGDPQSAQGLQDGPYGYPLHSVQDDEQFRRHVANRQLRAKLAEADAKERRAQAAQAKADMDLVKFEAMSHDLDNRQAARHFNEDPYMQMEVEPAAVSPGEIDAELAAPQGGMDPQPSQQDVIGQHVNQFRQAADTSGMMPQDPAQAVQPYADQFAQAADTSAMMVDEPGMEGVMSPPADIPAQAAREEYQRKMMEQYLQMVREGTKSSILDS